MEHGYLAPVVFVVAEPTLLALQAAAGLTDAQVDALFAGASA